VDLDVFKTFLDAFLAFLVAVVALRALVAVTVLRWHVQR
jgi:hypothetical protein